MVQIIDGKALAKSIRQELKEEVDKLKEKNIKPKLAVILVGDDKASKIYVKNKSRACEEVGIDYEEHILSTDTKMEELLNLILSLNKNDKIHGILLQSPLPQHLDINKAFATISYEKDVDGFHPINVGKLSLNQDCFVSCTPYGVIRMLEAYGIEIEGKNAVILRKK